MATNQDFQVHSRFTKDRTCLERLTWQRPKRSFLQHSDSPVRHALSGTAFRP